MGRMLHKSDTILGILEPKSCAARWCVFEMKPGHSIIFKKAIDKIQSDNFKIDWTAGEKLANLRFVRDVTVQLSTELIRSLECSATIQMNKTTVTYAALINTTPSYWRQHSSNSIFQLLLVLMKLLLREKVHMNSYTAILNSFKTKE